ncbi:TPA: cupin, partial [Mannheimia haemolytica]|nr:cupin [Mannheimia haemolytica]
HYFGYENKIISNGYGISLDEEFGDVIKFLKQGQEVSLNDILEKISEDKRDKVSQLIWQLSYIGVLKLS